MKQLLAALLIAVTALGAFAEGENVIREHRAIWFSPMLSSTWPGGNITASGVEGSKKNLRNYLKRLREHGINTLYFHVRAHCDATYASSYEPYASSVAGTRGGTPAIDPFGYFVEAAHQYGFEVYAWVNPYRYSSGGSYGEGERNYENSHPEWLLSSSDQKILNPGIPEVRQRVVDICTEIATNYDIDGMIFDDYFYHSSIGLDADKDLWQAYRNAGGNLSQEDWRRNNVNMTVEGVRDAVKAARPYAVFAMGPAGRISPPNIASYGLTPGPYGDMNYTGLYADPIYWLSAGYIDFLSPQVYWHSYFDKLTDWYSVAVPHFNRHLYTSVDCSRLNNNASEYLRQIAYMRSHVRPNESGVVFFDYGSYTNYREKYNGKNTRFGEILRDATFPYEALSPIHHWRTPIGDCQVGAVTRTDNVLSWAAPEGAPQYARRYAVYAIPAEMSPADFACQPEYLVTSCYSESYEIPADDAAKVYAVAVYDRYSNLHGARFEGTATLTPGVAPTAMMPATGAVRDLGRLSWTHAGAARYQVEIAEDAAFTTFKGMAETFDDQIKASDVADLAEGTTYFWRVKAYAADHTMAVSEVRPLSVEHMAVTSPAAGATGLAIQPEFTWTPAADGSLYCVQIANDADFTDLVYASATQAGTSFTLTSTSLESGRWYYARIMALTPNADDEAVSASVRFATAERTDYAAPAIINPSADGVTLNTDDTIEIEHVPGMGNRYVEISSTDQFATRTTFKQTLTGEELSTKALADVKISSKALVAGNTYYVRARGGYSLLSSQGVNYTAYGPTRSFIYSGEAGIFAPETLEGAYVDHASVLHLPAPAAVTVYDIAGRTVVASPAASEVDLSALPAGVYVIHANNCTLKWVK